MPGTYVISFDDILVFTTKLVYESIQRNWNKFSKFFWNPGFITTEQLYSRHFYNLNEWLIKNEYKEMTSNKYSSLQLYIIELLKEHCYSGNMYKGVEVTPFAQTLQNPLFLNSNEVKEIVIISKSVTEEQERSKEEYIKRNFTHQKIKYEGVDDLKGYIKNNSFDVFICDQIPTIRTVIEMTKDKKQIILPKYGYNYPFPKELRLLIESFGGAATYFNQFKNKG